MAAGNYTWSSVEIGAGGFVTGTVFHPTEPGLVYARTDVGGSYRLDAATNRWIALNDDIGGLNNEFQHLGVLTIGLDPSDPDRLYIATGQYGGTESWKLPSRIYRSSDRGATWEGYVTPGFKMAGNGEGRGTGERFAVNPTNGAILLVGTSDQGIWRSTDSGVTWARLPNFSQTITGLNFLIYAPANASGPGPARRVYAAGRTLTEVSLWYSDNNGDTWTAAPNQPGRVAGKEMFPIMGSFDAAGTFYVTWGDQTGPASWAANYGVWKLPAGSTTWTSILPPTGQGFFAGISADPRVAGHVVATTILRWYPGDEVYRSTNGGATWTAVLRSTGTTISTGNSPWAAGLTPHWMTDIDIDPFNSDRAVFNTGFGLFQTTNLSAASTSRVWTFFNDGLEELVPLGLLSPNGGAPLISVTGDYTGFRHDNLNQSPQRGTHNPMNGSNGYVTGAALAPLVMVRQHSSDTLLSRDGAGTWTRPNAPPSAINGHGRVAISSNGTRFLWSPSGSGSYYSSNNGSTWSVSANSTVTNASSNLTITTLAGTLGTPGATNDSGTDASFRSPEGIAIGSTGVRYVADTGNHLIRVINSGASVSTLAGGAGVTGSTDSSTGANARFNSPSGVVVASGAIFVADTNNHTIRRIATGGNVTTFAGTAGASGSTNATGAAARFNAPRGIAADSSGNLYVADTGNHVIRKITTAGVVTTLAGTAASPGSADGTGAAARFNAPRGIAVDSSGNVWVADTGSHTIRKITSAGAVTTFAGTAGSSGSTNANGTAARFNAPAGLAIETSGVLHVADTGNHAIRRITTAGVVTTVAGTAGSTGTTNSTGAAARFNAPAGIAVEPAGYNLYTADTNNHGIRRMSAHLGVTPVADQVNALRFYLWNGSARTLLTSTNGAQSFTSINTAIPTGIGDIRSVPGKEGHLWARAGASGLYQSTNFGATFTKLSSLTECYQVGFGKAATGATYPAIFIWGKVSNVLGFFLSENGGTSWTRINTNAQQFGYINDMVGDPRVYGRVYLATSGRGVIYGESTPAVLPAAQASSLIYGDSLATGWTSASTSGVSLTSNAIVRRGTAAVSVPANTANVTYTVSFNSSTPRSTIGMSALSFWVYSGTSSNPPALSVGASRGNVMLEFYPVTVPQSPGWQRILLPLAGLGLDSIEDLTSLRIQARTVGGVLPPAFVIDDVALIGRDDYNTNVQVNLSGLTASFDGTPKTVTVNTVPAGKTTVVTYNGSTTAPSARGDYAVVAPLLDPFLSGSTAATLRIVDTSSSIQFTNLIATADGTPKAPAVSTSPAGLAYSITYNGSTTDPSLAGQYAVVATITEPGYLGTASGTFTIRQATQAATDITGWTSGNSTGGNLTGKISGNDTASPLFTPNDTSDQYSTNTLQAHFAPVRLLNVGDTLTVTGSYQFNVDGVAGQGSWLRFGLFDSNTQPDGTMTGWYGGASIGGSYYERTASTGLFTTGSGATLRASDASPTPVNSTSPSGRPSVAFEVKVTRTASGVVHSFLARRTDTNAILISHSYTDTTPNNNGTLGSSATSEINYSPTYNALGLSFGRGYVGSPTPVAGLQAQFSNIRIAFTSGLNLADQFITFPKPADRPMDSAPFALSANASSGLPVSFELLSGPATLSGNTLTLTGGGTVILRAFQSGNATFNAAPPFEQSFESTKFPATVTLGSLTRTYTGSPLTLTATTSPSGRTVDFTFDGSPAAPTNAGSYNVTGTINDPTYSGEASELFVIQPANQTITFPAQGSRGVGENFNPGATSSIGLPVTYEVVSGPAETDGSLVTVTGIGTLVLSASQNGNENVNPAAPVERTLTTIQGTATVTLGNLNAMYDGQPKLVSVTTAPEGLPVSVTYNGSPTPPTASGSYAIEATVTDPNYNGSASGTLTIAQRTSLAALTGWRVSNNTTVSDANTNSPLLNANNGNGTTGAATNFYTFFEPVTLENVGDSVRITGMATVNAPGGTANQGVWFRHGLYDNRDQSANVTSTWLGYAAMANSSGGSSLYERTGNGGDFGTQFTGVTARTPDASPAYVGANSPSGNVTLTFEQTITRYADNVTVVSRLVRPGTGGAADTVYLSSTYTDTTPNNNGLTTGNQTAPTSPVYSPRYNAIGLVLSGAYIGSNNTSSVQFNDVNVAFTSGTDVAPPTITFAPIEDRPYSTTPMPLSASVSSGLPATFSLVSGPATLSGNALTFTGPGTVTVRAEQVGGLTTPPAAPVERTFEVTKASATVDLSGLNVVYDGSEKHAGVTTTPAGLAVVVTYNDQLTSPSAVGSYTVVATIDDANYEGSATGVFVISAPRFTWTAATTGGNLSWSTPSNWSSATPPASGGVSTVAFLTGETIPSGTITANQNLEDPLSFHLLELNGTGPASESAVVRLTGLPIYLVPSNTEQPTILVNALSGAGLTYELAFGIQDDAQLTIEGGGSANLTISGPITGPGGLTMSALLTVTLTGNQSFTGPTVVESGTLAVAGTLSGTGSVTVGSGGTLNNAGLIETPEVTVLSGGTLGGAGTIRGNVTVSGEVIVVGPGTWRVEGDVTNTGTIRLTQGARLEVTGSLNNQGVLDLLAASSSYSVGAMNNTGEIVTAQSFASATTGFDFDGTEARISFASHTGHAFQLERSLDLSVGSWGGVGTPADGTGGEITLVDSTPPTGSRFFYRVKVVPLNP